MRAPARTLVLVGLPGAGKTTVGATVATALGWGFLDFDAELERREGATVAELFRQRGERYFRQLELSLTRELAGRTELVLAPGGGWVTNAGAMALLQPSASIVYLRLRPETALRRLGEGRVARPLLLRPDPLHALRELLVKREPLYAKADHVIDVDLLDPQEVTSQLVRLARGAGAG